MEKEKCSSDICQWRPSGTSLRISRRMGRHLIHLPYNRRARIFVRNPWPAEEMLDFCQLEIGLRRLAANIIGYQSLDLSRQGTF